MTIRFQDYKNRWWQTDTVEEAIELHKLLKEEEKESTNKNG